jgi:hypothetical protein
MVGLRGTLTRTGRDLSLDPDLRDVTEHGQGLFLRVPDPRREDEEAAEIALVVTEEAGEEEAPAIAATAVMMIGAEAGAVDEVAVADGNSILLLSGAGVWDV